MHVAIYYKVRFSEAAEENFFDINFFLDDQCLFF